MRILIMSTLAAAALTSACTTTRADLRDANRDVRDAQAYGDRQDVREAKRERRETKRDYQDDHQCGPAYGRPC
jgi:predicted small secreted protein